MPELPEVETIVADLRPHLVGRTIVRCELNFPTIVRHPEPEEFVDAVVGMRIDSVGRRGKYILISLTPPHLWGGGGEAAGGAANNLQLVVHLGMTGQLRLVDPVAPLANHTHAVFFLDDGRQLRYRDPRRFGRLLLGTEQALLSSKKMPRLGPEPIDPEFAPDELYRRLRTRRAAIKAVLLDQGAIAGVGNIYADESLHKARLRPDRIAGSLSKKSARRLHESLRESLTLAIANRGSSVDTYRDAWGEIGGQQEKLLVYGRAGEPCFTCGRPLTAIRIAGRTTVFCRRCQR
ncbi:MAG: bifunctional DNA-formamidopyrimidine glycosylase/DNA-(apurinic or apyrimidinic site) lyase [Chloroflexi bacterium]|nr:MAG: bifunctional DNA-formamidopyrimidine glycosylase/DNA-(apurinic or apyrimidinic site) lyase [Chloroflexota bacterium]TMG31926.1 MAG: bifunctional DNA-formamidopyrimidine glycosylase/DNA-(apurinic or apyrimidinic site) lyase [Chloroflexota bacterium]